VTITFKPADEFFVPTHDPRTQPYAFLAARPTTPEPEQAS
jgi:hypothetical protein